MSKFEETGPATPVTEGIRVDKVSPRARFWKRVRALFIILFTLVGLIPVFVMTITAFKSRTDVVSVPPKIIFEPTLEGFVFLLTERSQLAPAKLEEARANNPEILSMEQQLLEAAMTRFRLSPRSLHRILKVARSIADLGEQQDIRSPHLQEAIGYRCLDRAKV